MQGKVTREAIAELMAGDHKVGTRLWDTELTGFGVVRYAGSASFVVNTYVDGAPRMETIGPCQDFSVDDARKKATQIKGRRYHGELTELDEKRLRETGPTLRQAAESYLDRLRSKSAQDTSITTIQREILDGRHLRTWLDRPLRSITPDECRERHKLIAVKQPDGTGGPHVANRVMRHFRAIYNHATKERKNDPTWPQNSPTSAVHWITGEQETFNDRARDPIPWKQLPTWASSVNKLTPIRRDYYMLVLLTGLRRRDAATILWDHVNASDQELETEVWNARKKVFDAVTLPPFSMLRPAPKGGPKKAFFVPLSREAIEILERRRKNNRIDLGEDDNGWVFPTRALGPRQRLDASAIKASPCSLCGQLGRPAMHVPGGVIHLIEAKEKNLRSPHRCRDTYATAANQLRLPEGTIGTLLNHKRGRNVTRGYIKEDFDYLRQCQQQISDFFSAKIGAEVSAQEPGQAPHHPRYTPEYRLRILRAHAAAVASGRRGAVNDLLRRTGLTASRLSDWAREEHLENRADPVMELQDEVARLRALLAGTITNR